MENLNLKRIIMSLVFIIIFSSIFIIGCGKKETTSSPENNQQNLQQTEKSTSEQNIETKDTSENIAHEHVDVPTMQCSICKKNIEIAVKKLDGIESINVDKKEKVAHVHYDKSKTGLTKIESVITAAGYDANDKKADPEAYKKLADCCKLPKDRK